MKKAGYATNPRYPQVIIKLIEDYQLQDYTMIAMGKMPPKDQPVVQTEKAPEDVIAIAASKTEPPVKREQPSYPEGVFKINDTKVLFVKAGTSWLSIAQQYDISLARLFDFNDMAENETADKDQLIYLMRKRRTGNNDFHIVQPGESLHDIAQQEAIRMEALLEYNFLSYDMQPAIGEKLSLRGKSSVMPKLALKENLSLKPANQKWNNN